MSKNLIEEYREVYNKRLNTWCKSKGYTDPFLYGYAKEKVKVGVETYTLCNKVHSNVCDDPYCRALHTSTDEYTQKQDIVNILFIVAIHEILNYVGFVLIGCKKINKCSHYD